MELKKRLNLFTSHIRKTGCDYHLVTLKAYAWPTVRQEQKTVNRIRNTSGNQLHNPRTVKKLIRVGLKWRLWDRVAVKGNESRAVRREMRGTPRTYRSSGCRVLLIQELGPGLPKPLGDPSPAGVAARGESRAPNTRGGFKSTRSKTADTERDNLLWGKKKKVFVQCCKDFGAWAFQHTLALLYEQVFTFPV